MMNKLSTLIYELKGLIKTYNNQTVLNIGRLQFHRGTVYGIIGPIGSGKSTLMKIMAGIDKESAGTIKYDDEPFESNWLGKIRPYPEIQLFPLERQLKGGKVSALFNKKPTNEFVLQYFNKGACKNLLEKNVNDLSKGEVAYLNMIQAVESDPRVLLIDDYGIFFDKNMEIEFRKKLNRMNKDLGTTILLSSPDERNLKLIASVLIYLDNGHISKIRSGVGRGNAQRSKPTKQSKRQTQKRSRPKQRSSR